MVKVPKQQIYTGLLIALLGVIMLGLLGKPATDSGVTGMIVSDGSYRSPTSDGDYAAPKTGPGYVAPKIDKSYEAPTTGPGYIKAESDKNFSAPTSDANFTRPTTGPGFIAPNLSSFTGPTTDNSSIEKTENQTTGKHLNESQPLIDKNESVKKNATENILPPQNESLKPIVNATTPKGPIDPTLVGKWKPYSESIYYKNGDFEFAQTSNAELTLHRDGTWIFGNRTGTWQVLPITEEDWTVWGIHNDNFKTKLVLYNWEGNYATGPIEETSWGAKYLWAVYNVDPPALRESAQVWQKFAPAPVREGDTTFSEKSIMGKWRRSATALTTATVLHIQEDSTWTFSSSSGTWKILPIDDADWKKWGLESSGQTHKLILEKWNGVGGDGPITVSGGEISLFTIYTKVKDPDTGKESTMSWEFIILQGDNTWLTAETKGQGKITSDDGKIDCGKSCTAQYATDAEVTITAKADDGWTFSRWNGGCQVSENVCLITLDKSKTASAVFVPGCKDDAACPQDQVCTNSQCTPVVCPCGKVDAHACQKYACCSDKDCDESSTCDITIHQCVQKSLCHAVAIYGDPAAKHDIVFVGDGFTDYEQLKKLILLIMDYDGRLNGVFTVSPFKESMNTFNVWMVTAPDYKHDDMGEPDHEDYLRFVKGCDMDTVIVASRSTYRPHAFFPTDGPRGGTVFLSLGFLAIRSPEFAVMNTGRLLLHELGHAIGGLADEYVEYGKGTRYIENAVNCAPDLATAKKRWGDLVGVGGVDYYTGVKDVPGTKYYKSPAETVPELGRFPDGSDWSDGGCSYDWNNIRPTIGSLMNNQFDLDYNYGPVDEQQLRKKLAEYTESPTQDTQTVQPQGGRGRRFIEDSG
ncbi:hypothetical protein HZB01_03620 [Candidatus Woesearchaeota archaeon]|nr:hypothetical protein [Candidatus Woesearchaeota archaeon]